MSLLQPLYNQQLFDIMQQSESTTAQALANYQRSIRLNSFQPQVAERIALLTQAGGGRGLDVTIPGNTRIVTRPNGQY